jgi:hypothetical protein
MDVPFRIFEVREMTDAEKVEFKERMQMSLSVRLGLVAKALFRNGATIELTAVAHEKSPWAREDVWRVLVDQVGRGTAREGSERGRARAAGAEASGGKGKIRATPTRGTSPRSDESSPRTA